MKFDDAWLEARSCAGNGQAASVNERMLEIPAVSEVLKAAANTSKHFEMWDYSRRLYRGDRNDKGCTWVRENGRRQQIDLAFS